MEETQIKFEYTNNCTCEIYDAESDEYYEAPYCNGDCYYMMIEDFENITSDLFNRNPAGWWKITDLRLWDGNHSGFVKANTPEELIRGMTVNSDWIIRGEVLEDRVQYSLSHHDSLGSSTTVTIVEESDLEIHGLV